MMTRDARACGHVRRYHTTLTAQGGQSVAEHTWQVMRIYFQCFGPMNAEVSTYLLLHDAGEICTGDVPHHAKRDWPALKEALDAAESAALAQLLPGVAWNPSSLTYREQLRAKACDMIEVIEYCVDEYDLGSRRGDHLSRDAWLKLRQVLDAMRHVGKQDDVTAVQEYQKQQEDRRRTHL